MTSRCYARKLLANRIYLQAALSENLRCKAFFLAQQSQEQMFGADVLVAEPLRFFSP